MQADVIHLEGLLAIQREEESLKNVRDMQQPGLIELFLNLQKRENNLQGLYQLKQRQLNHFQNDFDVGKNSEKTI